MRQRRPATPGPSIRSRPDCCRCASAKPPSSRRPCSTRARNIWRRSGSAPRRPPAMRKAKSSPGRKAPFRVPRSKRSCRASSAGSCSGRRLTRRSSSRDAAITSTRAGVSKFPRVPRAVEIHAIDVVDWSPPDAVLHVACGKGTYIRVLAEDLAAAVGSCAHLAALRRTATGPQLAGAATLERLEAMDPMARDALLLPADAPLAAVARLDVDAPTAQALVDGRIGSAPREAPGRYRCYGPGGRFLGLVECSDGTLRALRLSRTDTPPAPRVGAAGLTLES